MSSKKRSAANTCGIHTRLRQPCSTEGFCAIKEAALGRDYTLTIVLIGDTRARTLNKRYRNKTTPANVLSFPLTKSQGEIYLNPARAQREAHRFGLSPEGHLRYLLIHGCLHLAGHDHGSTMERAEAVLKKRFHIR